MTIFLNVLFILTAGILILASLKLFGLLLGKSINLPPIPFTSYAPDCNLTLYPSMFFQVWFWAERLGLLTI